MPENTEIKNTNPHAQTNGHVSIGGAYLEYKKILSKIKERPRSNSEYKALGLGSSITNKIKKRKEEIENDDLEQNIRLKKHTLYTLFGFLALETVIIFTFSFLQATSYLHFRLEEWSFKLLVTATISQITYMVQVAVKHLYPNK